MIGFIKRNKFLVAIIFLAFFFYTFRLDQTFVMAGDTARDLMRVMEIWQSKEITAIGPPVNTISDNPIQIYFGSLHYYFGLLGLLVVNFNPIGSVFVNILLTIASIPFFFLLSEKILKKRGLALLSTFVYAFSPITIALARSYWNPNLVIPLSVFAWFLLLYKRSQIRYFLAGITIGIIFNLHYMDTIPLILYVAFSFFRKDRKYLIYPILGLFISMLPFIAFEFKNNFFLVKAFIGTLGGFSTFSERTGNPFLSMDTFFYVFGLGHSQYFIPSLIDLAFSVRIIVDSIVAFAFILFLTKNRKVFDSVLIIVVVLGLLTGWFFEVTHLINIRYILSAYPLFIIFFAAFISWVMVYLWLILATPVLVLSVSIITHKLNPLLVEDYYPVGRVEEIAKAIVKDDPSGKYNVTENILGDARSLSFRYFLARDASVQPESVQTYDRIDTLYVVTPSLERTYEESRWEFNSSGPKKIVWQKDFGDLKLYKFVK